VKRRNEYLASVCTVLASASLLSATAAAQDDQDTGRLNEISVTARYKTESVQTVPIAITAISGQQLEFRGLTNVTDLGHAVPNLYTAPGDAVRGPTPTIAMRGVVAREYSFALEPAVGVYIDEVYHSTMVGAAFDLTDLDRIEVRRGPQGTLAGNASIAGTIGLFSKVPEGQDTGYAEAEYGSRNQVNIRAAFDTALTENLFMRVSGVGKRQDGYVDQLDFTCMMNKLGTPQLAGTFPTSDRSAGQRGCKIGTFGGTSLAAAKTMFRWVASDRLEFNLIASYSNESDEAPAEILLETHPSTTDGFGSVYGQRIFDEWGVVYDSRFLPPAGMPYSAYTTFSRPLEGIQFDNSQGQTATDVSLKVDYDLTDAVHLKGIAAYNENDGFLHQAGDVSPLGWVQGYVLFKTTQRTGELRLTGSAFDGRLDWVTGVYVLDTANHLSGDIDFVTLNFTEDDHFNNASQSAFVHLDYKLTDRLSLSGGGRFARVKKGAVLDHPPLFNTTIPFNLKKTYEEWSVSANYQVLDDVMAYTTVATGSRPPGITTIVNTIYQLSQYPAERLTSYEAGIKSEFFNQRLRVNLTGFYSDYSKRLTSQLGYQCLGEAPPPTRVLDRNLCPPGGAITWSTYIGTPVKITGIEWEITAEPIDGMLVNFSGGTNHVKNGIKTPGQPGYTTPGNWPQPKLNMAGGIQYGMHVVSGTFTPRLDWFYVSKEDFNRQSSAHDPLPIEIEPGYSLFNAQAEYRPDSTKWSMVFAVTNLTDKKYQVTRFDGTTVAWAGVIGEPRAWSIKLRRDF
jgi:iron complex outermembrane recepter protein